MGHGVRGIKFVPGVQIVLSFRRFLRVFHRRCFLRLVLRNLFLLEGFQSMIIIGAICVILV
jgi:hypothetical protein